MKYIIAVGVLAIVAIAVLTGNQPLRGDVDGNGVIEPIDAEILADWVFHNRTTVGPVTGVILFDPSYKIHQHRADCNKDKKLDVTDIVCITNKIK